MKYSHIYNYMKEKKKKKIILCLSWDFADRALSRTENYLNNDNGGERALRGYYLYKAFKGKYEVKVLCYKNHSSIKENIIEVPFSKFIFHALSFIKWKIWQGLPHTFLHTHYCDLMLKRHVKKVDNFIFFPRNRFCVSKAYKKNMKVFYNPIYPPYEKLTQAINENKPNNINRIKGIRQSYHLIYRKIYDKYYTNSEEKCDIILTQSMYNKQLYLKEFQKKKNSKRF